MTPGRLFLSDVYDLAMKFEWEEEEKKRNLSPIQRFLVITLFKFMGGKDHCWPTQRKLSEATGLCIRQIKTVLKELDRIGVIERDKRQAMGRVHEYRFTKEFIQGEPKGAICAPSKGATCAPLKVQSMHPDGATCAPSRCNLMHSKVPHKQASHERAGAEYISNRSMNKSINQSGKNDGLMNKNKKISDKKKPASEEVDPLVWNEEEVSLMETENENFVPPPGAPPRLTPDRIKVLFGGPVPRPVNLLGDDPEGEILSSLIPPFKKGPEVLVKIIGFNPGISQVEWFEKALKEFYRKVIDRHWNKKASPPGTPFRNLFLQAGRSGLLYEYGFQPLSPEQVEAQRLEQERREEDAAEAARIKEEERHRLAEKDAALSKFVKRPPVRNYLDFKGIPRKLGAIRDHLREITARPNGPATVDAIEQFMREELRKEGY